jgi:RNA polymerase sigma-70 factor (ECF subfamily)
LYVVTTDTRRTRFEALFEAHYASVLAYALRRVPRGMAEDVASETFIVAWRRLEDVPVDARPWLYGVARRVLANHLRADARRDRLSTRMGEQLDSANDADAPRVDGEVLDAIRRLPEREREALMLVAWEGLTPAQAAVAAGCSRVALRARLSRGRRHLAMLLHEAQPAPLNAVSDETTGDANESPAMAQGSPS